jgi:excinuclease ABC subunit B
MAKNPDHPKKPGKTPKSKASNSKAPNSKASRPDVQPIGPALAELLNPAINRGESGLGSGTGLQPPPDNSWDRRAGGEAAAHRARASTRGAGEDVAKRDAATKSGAVTNRDDASSSLPPRSGGEGSGVGGVSANSLAEQQADRPPTPDPSPATRKGAWRVGKYRA